MASILAKIKKGQIVLKSIMRSLIHKRLSIELRQVAHNLNYIYQTLLYSSDLLDVNFDRYDEKNVGPQALITEDDDEKKQQVFIQQ
jgi:hypothetical protein